jgi:ankyrin repeat protein
MAVEKGEKALVELLLAKNASVDAKTKYTRWTPLHYAAREGRKEMAELLLAKGAEIDSLDRDGHSPLHIALDEESFLRGHLEAVMELTRECKPESIADGGEGKKPLDLVKFEGHLGVVGFLLANGANVNTKDNEGKTLLHWRLSIVVILKL